MGQKGEKYARSIEARVQEVERRMDDVWRRQMTSDHYIMNLQKVNDWHDETLLFERREHRHEVSEARREAHRWKLNAILALILFSLTCAVLIVQVSAEESPIVESGPTVHAISGDLPGDDVPAPVRCSMTPEETEAAENEMIESALLARATRLDDVMVTHYCTCFECCGKDDGITASGLMVTPGVTVAVDPDVIPLGADVLVDYGDGEIQYYRADDTGGAIKGNKIDLCMESHEAALQAGVKTATVWWVIP